MGTALSFVRRPAAPSNRQSDPINHRVCFTSVPLASPVLGWRREVAILHLQSQWTQNQKNLMNKPQSPETEGTTIECEAPSGFGRLHLVVGWWGLLLFLVLGMVLEALHAFKIGWYLNVGNEARRLMFTLGHAHGALLSVINIVFGLCVVQLSSLREDRMALASRCLLAGTVLLPGGFLLGGVYIFGGDPGLGIFLVPAGAGLLILAVLLVAIRVTRG